MPTRLHSFVVLMGLLAPSSAFADDELHHPTMMVTFGASLGIGGASETAFGTGRVFETDLHLGRMITRRVALMFEGQVDLVRGTFDQHAAMAAVQLWLLPSLWIKPGVGIAGISTHVDGVTTSFGVGYALLAATGLELQSTPTFAIDLQARFIEGLYLDGLERFAAGTVGVGLSWY